MKSCITFISLILVGVIMKSLHLPMEILIAWCIVMTIYCKDSKENG